MGDGQGGFAAHMLVTEPDIPRPPRRVPGGPHRVASAWLASLRFAGRCARSTVLIPLTLGLLAPATLVAQEPQVPKAVLILLPDQPILPGTPLLLAGVRGQLVTGWGPRVSIYSEHVDIERYQGADVEQRVRDAFRAKYAGVALDAIVAYGPSPAGFLARWGSDLWPGVPVVVAGVDELLLTRLQLPPRVVAIPMRYDVEGTVRLALRLLPETRRVALISGMSPQNRHFADLHRERLRAFGDRLELIDLTGLSLEEMLVRVAALPEHSILMVSQVWLDGAGRSLVGLDFLPRVSAVANRPVFSVFGPTVGAGAVGGSTVDLQELGVEAGRVAVRILRGEAVPPPEASQVSQQVLVDWRQLRRWGLDERRLPPGSGCSTASRPCGSNTAGGLSRPWESSSAKRSSWWRCSSSGAGGVARRPRSRTACVSRRC